MRQHPTVADYVVAVLTGVMVVLHLTGDINAFLVGGWVILFGVRVGTIVYYRRVHRLSMGYSSSGVPEGPGSRKEA